MKLFRIVLLTLFVFTLSVNVKAQSFLAGKDLSTIKVDALTESELTQLQQQLKSSGLTIDQIEQQAIAKGMSASEFAKLKVRLQNVKAGNNANKSPLTKQTLNTKLKTNNNQDTTRQLYYEPIHVNPLIYGSELFNPNTTGFGENQNIATPLNYEIGPNDVLKLVVYGVQEYSADLTVSKEGLSLIHISEPTRPY